ncbi:hypothetical protein L596_016831 [Steinernema carpocapsae]|uniref:TILa domain-containing protein n=1 Tax=Steinernema carpocapsae TaxID=34508 RepID=A0A4V6A3H7_STECR|nr:hypothetical protein L596_016831 [Steinernema carpocapsae]
MSVFFTVVLFLVLVSGCQAFPSREPNPTCTDEFGKTRPAAYSWFDKDCTSKNVCLGGFRYRQPIRCPEKATCQKSTRPDYFDYECVCEKGFYMIGNDRECRAGQAPTAAPAVPEKPKPTPPTLCIDEKGALYVNGRKWMSNNCTKNNVCIDGKILSEPAQCPKNGKCQGEAEWQKCKCEENCYSLDGIWCVKK